MSNLWIRVDADELNGERVAVLVAELRIDPIAALGHLVAFSGKVAHHRPSGVIADVAPALLEQWAGWRGDPGAFARVVVDHLCDPPGELREWLDTMGELFERRRKERERKQDQRRRQREEEEREEATRAEAAASAGRPADEPAVVPGTSEGRPRKSRPTGPDVPDLTGPGHSTGTVGGAPAAAAGWSELPPAAVRLLSLFYPKGKATAKRRRDVFEQLGDTIDPARPGAQLDRNTVVRAASIEQLELACQRVLARPPRDLDLGVRFVLHELTTLQKVQRIDATEGAAARTAAEEQRIVAWRRARAVEIARWERGNAERSAELRTQAERDMPEWGEYGEAGRTIVLERYATLAAEAARFPDLEHWRPPAATSTSTRRGGALSKVADVGMRR